MTTHSDQEVIERRSGEHVSATVGRVVYLVQSDGKARYMSAHGHMVEVTPSMSLKDVCDAYHDKMRKATRHEGV